MRHKPLAKIGVYNNDGILDFEHKSNFFITLWDVDSQFGKFKYLIIFFVESASLLFKNQLFGEKRQCSGHLKPGNSCKINALDSVFWGKYIQEKKRNFGEKNYWGKKIQTRTGTGKKETPYLTAWGDFCPPFKNLLSTVSQSYFSISYLFSQDTHIFPLSKHSLFSQKTIFSQIADCVMNQVFVLKPLPYVHREKTVISTIRRLREVVVNARCATFFNYLFAHHGCSKRFSFSL
jgi:hypothetical protein